MRKALALGLIASFGLVDGCVIGSEGGQVCKHTASRPSAIATKATCPVVKVVKVIKKSCESPENKFLTVSSS